jgi:hypothetical protein
MSEATEATATQPEANTNRGASRKVRRSVGRMAAKVQKSWSAGDRKYGKYTAENLASALKALDECKGRKQYKKVALANKIPVRSLMRFYKRKERTVEELKAQPSKPRKMHFSGEWDRMLAKLLILQADLGNHDTFRLEFTFEYLHRFHIVLSSFFAYFLIRLSLHSSAVAQSCIALVRASRHEAAWSEQNWRPQHGVGEKL